MEKVTYTPAEFAEVFGKERTWGYRQLYAGKVNAITELGRTMIPKSEVDRLLAEAGRYLGAKAKVAKAKEKSGGDGKPGGKIETSKGAANWTDVIKKRKTRGQPQPESARSSNGRKPSSPERRRPYDQASVKRSVYQRLTRYKSSRKNDEGRGA